MAELAPYSIGNTAGLRGDIHARESGEPARNDAKSYHGHSEPLPLPKKVHVWAGSTMGETKLVFNEICPYW
ncbi:MAG: hypothetical protein HFJ69_02995 [Enterorhabdus sp.]|jgi:hypothetical protein|nr:hypothetical protein [Enterorhabdus sp.]